jgi:hypothetical protein
MLSGAAGCGDDTTLRADAGDDFSVPVGGSPAFDACGSSANVVSYTWTIVEAPPSMAQDTGKVIKAAAPECSFTLEAAMLADEAGRWVIELTATDADGNTSTDTVSVEVTG